MKPTENQKKIIDEVISIITTWKNSNDIKSPTLLTDVDEFINADLNELINNPFDKEWLCGCLYDLWYVINNVK